MHIPIKTDFSTTPLKYSGTGIHTLSISRIALKLHYKVPKFEHDAEIWQISADFEKCRFSKVSCC